MCIPWPHSYIEFYDSIYIYVVHIFQTKKKFNVIVIFFFIAGLLRLQQIYQGLRPGNETFQVETVKRIANASNAIDFLRTLEELNRFSKKFIVLDCPTDMAKDIVVMHVRDLSLGRRTYHYLFSGLVWTLYFAFLTCFVHLLVGFPCRFDDSLHTRKQQQQHQKIPNDFILLYDYYYYTIDTIHIRHHNLQYTWMHRLFDRCMCWHLKKKKKKKKKKVARTTYIEWIDREKRQCQKPSMKKLLVRDIANDWK